MKQVDNALVLLVSGVRSGASFVRTTSGLRCGDRDEVSEQVRELRGIPIRPPSGKSHFRS